jgi:hypothetical protein
MRGVNLIVGITLILLLISCSNKYEQEEQLYECLATEYAAEGIDLNKELDAFEQVLIEEKILKDGSGEAKVDFYKSVIENGEMPGLKNYDAAKPFHKLIFAKVLNTSCRQYAIAKDSVAFTNSRYSKVTKNIQIKAVKNGQISPITVSKAIVSELNAEDFEQPYYRAFMLLGFAFSADRESAYIRNIPKKLDSNREAESSQPASVIKLREDDSVVFNGATIQINNLELKYDAFMKNQGHQAFTYLYVKDLTKYEHFMKAQGIIEDYYKKVRNDKAKKLYKRPFDDLNSFQKNNVEELHPMKVIERKY